MPTISFVAPSFSVASAKQLTVKILRVSFSAAPNVNGLGTTSALNPVNYAVTGPTIVSVVSAIPTVGDSLSVDLTFDKPLNLGTYTLNVYNIVGA